MQLLDLSFIFDYCYGTPLSLRADDLHWLSGMPSLKHLDLTRVDLSSTGDQWIHQIIYMQHPSLSVLRLSATALSTPIIALPSFVTNFPPLTILDLSLNDFHSSALPHWLFGIRSLVELYLSGGNFGGEIPETLGNLHHLMVLDLSDNELTGSLPESIGNLHRLNYLYLNANHFMGYIPDTIGKLHNLVELRLSRNNITGQIPDTIGNLTQLSWLELSDNQISGYMPDTIGNLTELSYLDLSQNRIGGSMPKTLENLRGLWGLFLSENNISGQIPKHIGSLAKLIYLDLSYNQISGYIPVSVGNLSQLESLFLLDNNISGEIPRAMGSGLCRWLELDLSHNNIGGKITDFVDGLSRFNNTVDSPYYVERRLNLGSNKLTGTIPASLGQLSNVQRLDLSSNSFVGALNPAHFANLTSLYYFNLSHNQMNGELSVTIWNKSFKTFDVSFNNFTGPVPSLNVSIAYIINLSENAFTGTIPSSFAVTSNLGLLSLSGNRLNGSIPDHFFCHKPSLTVLDLSHNQLFGRIPDCLSIDLAVSLQSLHLSNNDLNGEIPSFLKRCTDLVVLDLGENKLSGTIPRWIGKNLVSLRILRLHSNSFTGIIPPQLSQLPNLQVLDLACNNLSGSLPPSFGNFSTMVSKQTSIRTSLNYDYGGIYYEESISIDTKGGEYEFLTTVLSLITTIDVSENSLSGEIPIELSNLHGLISMNLSGNHFTGKIPANIGGLDQLETLDLSRNNLSGKIPPSISALCYLSRLNLSNNNLSGRIPTGNQFSTLNDISIYSNNLDLCGSPLPECLGDAPSPSPASSTHQDDEVEVVWLYASIVFGFVVGFWGIVGTIMIRPPIRYALFRFVDKLYDWFYVQTAISFNKLNAILANRVQGRL